MTDRDSGRRPDAGPSGGPDALPLTAIAGLDAAEGLRLALGRDALYRRLLVRFIEGQSTVIEQVARARAQGDLETAVRAAHTLKGAAGQIAAPELQALARAWEAALQAGETGAPLEQAEAAVGVRLGALVHALCAALDIGVPPGTPPAH